MWARIGLAVAVVLPGIGVAAATGALADRVGTQAATSLRALDHMFGSIRRAEPNPDSAPASETQPTATLESGESPSKGETATAENPSPRTTAAARSPAPQSTTVPSTGSAPPTPARGIYVAADRVLELANSGVRPSGSFAPGTDHRPEGIVLSGVSSLGIGVQDGDVLTHVAGRHVRTRGAVVAAVIAARGKRADAIGGRFWRDGEAWQLSVEMPYPE